MTIFLKHCTRLVPNELSLFGYFFTASQRSDFVGDGQYFFGLLGIEEQPDLLFCYGLCMRGTRYSGTFLNQGTLSQ